MHNQWLVYNNQSRVIGSVRRAHSQLWRTIIPVCSHMLHVNITKDLAHLQLSDLQGEIRPICRTSDLQRERMLICRT